MVNYYTILGLGKDASQSEIIKSYRYLALKYHPDRNNNSEEAKQKFIQIVEAYQVLSNEQSRKEYDITTHYGSALHRWRNWQVPGYGDFGRVHIYTSRSHRPKTSSNSSTSSGNNNNNNNNNIKSNNSMGYISKNAGTRIRKARMVIFSSLASAVRSVTLPDTEK
ncbi:MAG: J domain-containing protein [Nitrososphaeraceae archaeon]|nr:J domain-containing protein [Nitrososphaeraceae archaeon]